MNEENAKTILINAGKAGKSFEEACKLAGVNEGQAAKYWPVVTAYHERKLAEFMYNHHYKYVIKGKLMFIPLKDRPEEDIFGWEDVARAVMKEYRSS